MADIYPLVHGMIRSTARSLRRVAGDFRSEAGYQFLQRRHRHNIHPRRLDITWTATHYNRISVVNLLLARVPNGKYLEIGCAGNMTFDSVIAAHKVGVDPAAGGTHRMTSDEYFAKFGDEKFDVIFIDGLHTYEQARIDVQNAIRSVNQGGWIAFHDMLPRDWLEEHVPRISNTWTGDVWKLAFELARAAPVDFAILKIDYGVGVLRPHQREVTIPDLRQELVSQRFAYLYENIDRLPIKDYREGREWLMERM